MTVIVLLVLHKFLRSVELLHTTQ